MRSCEWTGTSEIVGSYEWTGTSEIVGSYEWTGRHHTEEEKFGFSLEYLVSC